MPGHTAWKTIQEQRSKLSPEHRAAIAEQARVDTNADNLRMKLDELRKARSLSQEQLADQLGTNQGAVSRIERQTDLYVSTLRRFVHAVGGELRITVQFPDADPIELELFGDVEAPARALERA